MDLIPPSAGASLGLVLLLAGALLCGSGGHRRLGILMGAASAAAAVILAAGLSGVHVTSRPAAFRDWTLLALICSVPLAWLAAHGGRRATVAMGILVALLVGLFLYPTAPLHERYWEGRVALHVAGLSLMSWLAIQVRRWQAARARVAEGMIAFALVAVAAAPTLGFTGTGISAALAGALGGATGLFGLTLLLRPGLGRAAGSLCVSAGITQAVGLIGALATGALYAETPLWSAGALALAPALTLLPGAGRRGLIIRLASVGSAAAAPAVAAYLASPGPNPYG